MGTKILGMMANMLSWAPIVAFMVASPLTFPLELIYSACLFGWPVMGGAVDSLDGAEMLPMTSEPIA